MKLANLSFYEMCSRKAWNQAKLFLVVIALLGGLSVFLAGRLAVYLGDVILDFEAPWESHIFDDLLCGASSVALSLFPFGFLFLRFISGHQKSKPAMETILQTCWNLSIFLGAFQAFSCGFVTIAGFTTPLYPFQVLWNNITIVLAFGLLLIGVSIGNRENSISEREGPKIGHIILGALASACAYSIVAIFIVECDTPSLLGIVARKICGFGKNFETNVWLGEYPYSDPYPYENSLNFVLSTSVSIWSLPIFFSYGVKKLKVRNMAWFFLVLCMTVLFSLVWTIVEFGDLYIGLGSLTQGNWMVIISFPSLIFWLWLARHIRNG